MVTVLLWTITKFQSVSHCTPVGMNTLKKKFGQAKKDFSLFWVVFLWPAGLDLCIFKQVSDREDISTVIKLMAHTWVSLAQLLTFRPHTSSTCGGVMDVANLMCWKWNPWLFNPHMHPLPPKSSPSQQSAPPFTQVFKPERNQGAGFNYSVFLNFNNACQFWLQKNISCPLISLHLHSHTSV